MNCINWYKRYIIASSMAPDELQDLISSRLSLLDDLYSLKSSVKSADVATKKKDIEAQIEKIEQRMTEIHQQSKNKRSQETYEKFDLQFKNIDQFLSKFNIGIRVFVADALKCNSFEEFSDDYTIQKKHGTYWHVTNNPNFTIDANTGPRDMSSLSRGEVTKGALMVTTDLSYWLDHYSDSDRKYVAEIDMSHIDRNDYTQVQRGFGNEFFIDDASRAKVIRVLSIEQAKRVDRERNKKSPSSKEELKVFYDMVHQKFLEFNKLAKQNNKGFNI